MTDHPVVGTDAAATDRPRAHEYLRRLDHAEGVGVLQSHDELVDLEDCGEEAQDNPTRHEGIDRVRNDVPRFGEVEDDAIEVGSPGMRSETSPFLKVTCGCSGMMAARFSWARRVMSSRMS